MPQYKPNMEQQQNYAGRIAGLHNIRLDFLIAWYAVDRGGQGSDSINYTWHIKLCSQAYNGLPLPLVFSLSFPWLQHL